MTSDNTEQNCIIETYGFTPIDAQSKNLYEQVYGKRTIELAHILRCIELETSKDSLPPHVLFQLIKSFFGAIKSQDPLAFHHDLSRKVLENEHKTKEIPSSSIDLLAREICNSFNEMGDKLFPIPLMQDALDSLDQSAKENGEGDSVLNIIEIDNPNADKECFNEKKVFRPLSIYLKFLESTGKRGKKQSEKIKERDVGAAPEFWFKTQGRGKNEHFFHSAAFLGFARILWEDKVKKRITFDGKYPPSTVKPTFETLSSIISAKKDVSSNPDAINLVKGIDIVGTIDIPLVPTSLHDKVFRGVGKINTVVGHKALRYAVSLPFEQKLKGVADFRVREFEGGFVELGEEMGLTNKRQLAELREVLYAIKHLDIPNIKDSRITKGRLVDVTHFRSQKTGREDGLILTVLPTLVAYGEVDCTGMLLIPMATLPPPVKGIAPTQYHAPLYYLQMTLLEEFSDKSKEFYQHKCIKISDEDWDRLLVKANIPIKYKEAVIKGWSEDGDAPKVLECVEKDHYSLGESYEKPSTFLMEQGKIRTKQSVKGKTSAQKRKLKKRH